MKNKIRQILREETSGFDENMSNTLYQYMKPKNYGTWSKPRSLDVGSKKSTFKSLAGLRTIDQEEEEIAHEQVVSNA